MKTIMQDPGKHSNWAPSKYSSEALPLEPLVTATLSWRQKPLVTTRGRGGLGGPTASMNATEKKNLLPLPGTKLKFLSQPACNIAIILTELTMGYSNHTTLILQLYLPFLLEPLFTMSEAKGMGTKKNKQQKEWTSAIREAKFHGRL